MSVALDPKPRKQLSVLVVQLGTIEESFRSLMALKAVKHLYPDTKIHVISRPEGSAPFKRVDWLASVLETPSLSAAQDPVPAVARWIDQVIGKTYDLSVNWTWSLEHSRMASILMTLIPSLVKFGDGLRDDASPVSYDAWSIYHHAWANPKSEVEQDIHPTDIITTQLLTALQIHVGDPQPEDGVSAVTSKYFFKMISAAAPDAWSSRPKNLKWAAVHYGSLGARAEEWIETVLKRHPDSGVVVLNETPLELETRSDRVINLSSQTHFDSSVQVLSQCQWLIAGQTPAVELASLLNTRIFQVVQGSGLKWVEQGPYGNTHVVCQFESEWEPEVAYAVWSHAQSEWFHKGKVSLGDHARNLGLADALARAQVYRSRIRAATEGGGVSYDRLPTDGSNAVATQFESWMYRIRGQMARAWFCGWTPPIEDETRDAGIAQRSQARRSRRPRRRAPARQYVRHCPRGVPDVSRGSSIDRGLRQEAPGDRGADRAGDQRGAESSRVPPALSGNRQ
jgi:ADP-heptose:LPS heptosyltransferase